LSVHESWLDYEQISKLPASSVQQAFKKIDKAGISSKEDWKILQKAKFLLSEYATQEYFNLSSDKLLGIARVLFRFRQLKNSDFSERDKNLFKEIDQIIQNNEPIGYDLNKVSELVLNSVG
jgi:hypothetical protein